MEPKETLEKLHAWIDEGRKTGPVPEFVLAGELDVPDDRYARLGFA